jgi:hypothetical protein
MQEGLQDEHGHFYLKRPSASSESVGKILSFNAEGSSEQSVDVMLAWMDMHANEWYCHPLPLGSNLYACAAFVPTMSTAVCHELSCVELLGSTVGAHVDCALPFKVPAKRSACRR